MEKETQENLIINKDLFFTEKAQIEFVKNVVLKQTGFTKLVLLFDTNRDGDLGKTFHEKCDNKGPTITFVWDDKGNVFGGFTNLSWTSKKGYKEEKKSYLFSINKLKMIYIDQNFEKAVCNNNSHGPIFGYKDFHDLVIYNECTKSTVSYQNLKNCYGSQDPNVTQFEFTGEKQFKVKEYKVFGLSN